MNALALLLLLSQEYIYDINGRRVPAPASINGRGVDPAQTEERVVEESGGRKVIERVTRRAAADGMPGSVEKVRIEEVKHPDGRVSTTQENYRGDINGRLVLAEKTHTDLKKTGDVIESVTTTSRGSLNGGLEVVERAEMTGRETEKLKQTDTLVFRKDANGSFREAARSTAERRQEDGKTVESVTEYNNATSDGRMRVAGQRVTTELQSKDGATVKQVEIYGVQPGRAAEPGQLKLREQQLIEQRPGAGKTVEESLSIRRPDGNGSLPASFTKVSDRVCREKCN
jgi:hypothetical protein